MNLTKNQINHKSKCENSFQRTSTLLVYRFSFLLQSLPSHVRMRMLRLRQISVRPQVLIGRAALLRSLRQLFQSKRHLVGFGLLGVGMLACFAQYLFLDHTDYSSHNICPLLGFQPGQCWNGLSGEDSNGWCYVSAFYYWNEVSFFVGLIFFSLAGFLLVPLRYSGISSIVFSFINALGWAMFIHRSFFAVSHETFIAIPTVTVIILALAFGFGVVLSAENIVNYYTHKLTGNECRHVGITEMKGMTPEQKEPLYQGLANEFRQIQKSI